MRYLDVPLGYNCDMIMVDKPRNVGYNSNPFNPVSNRLGAVEMHIPVPRYLSMFVPIVDTASAFHSPNQTGKPPVVAARPYLLLFMLATST